MSIFIFKSSFFTKNIYIFCIEKIHARAGHKKLLVCRHPTLDLQVGSVGRDFFYIGESQSRSQALTAFWYKLFRGKKYLYPRLLLQEILIRPRLINATRRYDLTARFFFYKQPNCEGSHIKNSLIVKQLAM